MLAGSEADGGGKPKAEVSYCGLDDAEEPDGAVGEMRETGRLAVVWDERDEDGKDKVVADDCDGEAD